MDCARLSGSDRVRPQNFQEQAASFNLFQGLSNSVFFGVSFQINEEKILPCFPARRTGLDFGHIDAIRGEGAKKVVQGARLIFDGQHDRGFVFPGSLRRVAGKDEESGEIVDVILNPGFENLQSIQRSSEVRGDGLSITLANRNQALFVATDAIEGLAVENISYDARTGRFTASLVAAAGTAHEARAEFSGRAIETVELPVLNRAMKKGEIISDGDIEWIDWQAKRTPRDAITDAADLVGQAARRSLRPDAPLRARDVGEPIVVTKGSAVRLVYRTPMMVLTAGGRALEDGAMGSVIRIRNSKSKVVVEARVDGANIVSVTGSTFLVMN